MLATGRGIEGGEWQSAQHLGDILDHLGGPLQQLGQGPRPERGQLLDHLYQRHAAFIENRVVEPLGRLGQAHPPDRHALPHQPRQVAGIDVHREERLVGQIGGLQRIDHGQ